MARVVEDPTKLGDMLPVGFGGVGGGVVDDELAEEGDGRRWDDHGPQWVAKEGKKDGFVSTLTRMVFFVFVFYSLLACRLILWRGHGPSP